MVNIRRAKPEDLEDIYRIECSSFSTPWSKKSIILEIENNQLAYYYVVEDFFQVVGYGGFWKIGEEAHIGNIAIEPESRNQGYGKLLMKALVEEAKELGISDMTLEVRPSNLPALKLYADFDFYKAGVRKGYYTDTKEDGWILWKEIK
ncbi:MAG: ribosomal protein S18-alanine N-acetyltransferase [Tissierellia bacterium]|nr:ribosomal protein S18-alanine N-acetyltransferase [Tissierellia bacterium]